MNGSGNCSIGGDTTSGSSNCSINSSKNNALVFDEIETSAELITRIPILNQFLIASSDTILKKTLSY